MTERETIGSGQPVDLVMDGFPEERHLLESSRIAITLRRLLSL